MTKTILLVHTGDGSQWVWPHWYRYWRRNWTGASLIDTVWLSENADPKFEGIFSIRPGGKTWGEQLILGLQQIDAKYVIYWHEDYFLVERPDLAKITGLVNIMDREKIVLLKACGAWMGCVDPKNPPAPSGMFYQDEELVVYNNKSDYLISHQSSIWEKDFLSSTVRKNDSPWQHETNGSNRLKERNIPLYAYRGYPPLSYTETVCGGKTREGMEGYFK